MSPQRMHGSVILIIISIPNCFFFIVIKMPPQRILVSVIFVIILILNCLFQLEFECLHKECKVLSSL